MPYLGPRALRKIQSYKYASGMYSFLDTRVMNPFWNVLVRLVPLWVAPNALTLSALACAVSSYALILWHCPTLSEEAPRWVWAYTAVALFLYQTLDAIDGKQARRTGSSSPLGQLFDHGCDAVAAVLSSTLVSAAIRSGAERLTLLMLLMHLVPFFVKNWEACHVDFMKHDVVGVTEAQLTIIAVMAATARWGSAVWAAEVDLPAFGHVTLSKLVVYATCGVAVWQTLESVLTVRRALRERGHTETEKTAAWTQIGQFFFFTALCLAWIECPWNHVWHTHTPLSTALLGLVFVYHVTLLIVAHVAGQHYAFLTPVLAPFPFVVANSYARGLFGFAFCDGLVAAVFCAYAGAIYLHYVVGVVQELCSHLRIRAFVIVPPAAVMSGDYAVVDSE